MNKTWLVMRNEILINVTRRSWLLITFGLPVLLALIVFARPLLAGSPPPGDGTLGDSDSQEELVVEGYVDRSGLIRIVPDDLSGILVAYTDEADASQALRNGPITAYYVIPEDYVETGRFEYVYPDMKGFEPSGQPWVMRWTLLVNLLGGDTDLAQRVWNPMNLKVTALTTEQPRDVGMGWNYWVPYATGMLLYVIIIMSSSLLRESFGKEKKSQVMEVLLVSVKPSQMLAGKISGLAVVGLLQTLLWAGTGYAMMQLGGQTLSLPAGFDLPMSVVLWALVFFVLGYAVYASLLAGLGALTGPNQMGSSSADFVVIWPLILPIFFMTFLIQNPNGLLATVLSLIPMTAPVAMMTRIAAGGVPWWHPVLAAALMMVTAVIVMRAVARVFRAHMLLSGQPFTAKRYFAALLGRV